MILNWQAEGNIKILNLFFLRPGDAVVVPSLGLGVLVRSTRGYWYYNYKEHICRVSKLKLWNLIDTDKVKIKYGSTLKRRKKKRDNRTLDLHGVKWSEVDEKTRSFLNFVNLPCKIITGKSDRMKAKVTSIVSEYGWSSREESASNSGCLLVTEI